MLSLVIAKVSRAAKLILLSLSPQHNIQIVTEWIPNEVSSTRIRRALKRGESVKYLLQDPVIDYVYRNGIYGASRPSTM